MATLALATQWGRAKRVTNEGTSTKAHPMRLTPAQIGVQLICGHDLPTRPQCSLRQRLIEGRNELRRITGVDFGYDLQRWHDHLKESRQGGYTWSRAIALPKIMAEALASPEWNEIVRELGKTP
jgi:hypothetical protein